MKRFFSSWARLAASGGAALVLLAAGCADSSPAPADELPVKEFDGDIKRVYPMLADVRVTATGAAEFDWSGRHEVQLTRVGSPELSVNLLSLGFMEPVITKEDPKNRFRWAFDLVKGYEDKPGTFTLDNNAVKSQGTKNLAFLIWLRVQDGTKTVVADAAEVEFLKEFREIRQPCTLTVGVDAHDGRLECPELATVDGEVTSLTVTWDNGEPQPTPEPSES